MDCLGLVFVNIHSSFVYSGWYLDYESLFDRSLIMADVVQKVVLFFWCVWVLFWAIVIPAYVIWLEFS